MRLKRRFSQCLSIFALNRGSRKKANKPCGKKDLVAACDPDKPARRKRGYDLFVEERFKETSTAMMFGARRRKVNELWNQLPGHEKKEYERRAAAISESRGNQRGMDFKAFDAADGNGEPARGSRLTAKRCSIHKTVQGMAWEHASRGEHFRTDPPLQLGIDWAGPDPVAGFPVPGPSARTDPAQTGPPILRPVRPSCPGPDSVRAGCPGNPGPAPCATLR